MRPFAPWLLAGIVGCSSSPLVGPDAGSPAGGAPSFGDASGADAGGADAADAMAEKAAAGSAPVVKVFDQIPQFGAYSETDPDYVPPSGVRMWSYGTVFVSQLSELQQAQLGPDLSARVSYFAQCDNYDRQGGLFFLVEPKGQEPEPTDPRIEMVRFITPFSDFRRGALAMHVYPNADISAYAQALADPTRDVWIGIAGGSNPYAGDACTDENGDLRAGVAADFAAVGFKYSVDFISTQTLVQGRSLTLGAKGDSEETALPIEGAFFNEGDAITGHMTVIVSGHGSAAGGDEYRYTADTVSINGEEVGGFSTQIDCAPYAEFSPDGNPGIFQGNLTLTNPRNWCPGALVPSHTFSVSLAAGMNPVRLEITPSLVPDGSTYATSISFSAP